MGKWDSLVKGALLHDVGKIAYRANKLTGAHSKRGGDFLEPYIQGSEDKQQILHSVRYHHAKELAAASHILNDDCAYIVYEADNIAAAVDRREYDEGEVGVLNISKFDKELPLQSIFRVFGGKTSKNNLSYPLRGLNIEEHFNYPTERDIKASPDKYQKIYDVLENNFKEQSIDTMSINELLRIYEDAVSYVPSSTVTEESPDISLYMHSKITAAIAVSMAMYFEAEGIHDYREACFKEKQFFRDRESFKLISGDISGIQHFIYTIPSKGALKSLRGRSFYLEILMEQVLDELLSRLHLSRVNLIYSGGGHFYILAPNTESIDKQLGSFQDHVNTWLLQQFGTQLYIAFGSASASANDLMASSSQRNIFRQVSKSVNDAKLNRYSKENLAKLFDSDSEYNVLVDGERECSICHASTKKLLPYGDDADTYACETCTNLFKLGKQIVDYEDSVFVIAIPKEDADSFNPISIYSGESICAYLYVVSEKALDRMRISHTIVRIYSKNRSLTGERVYNRLWIADHVARDENGKVYEFEDLAKCSGTSDRKGIKRLGVLRADVDNLGAAFIGGFLSDDVENPYKYGTLSRYADLSRDLSMFFKVAVNKMAKGDVASVVADSLPYSIWNDATIRSRNVHVIYSGGDDVFLVGAWDELLELAIDINNKLYEFSAGKITMSAGLALFSPSYPISQMAKITGLLESAAKNQPYKNSIALFGFETASQGESLTCNHIYSWDDLDGDVLGDKLFTIQEFFTIPGITADNPSKMVLGKSFVYKLMGLLNDIIDNRNNTNHVNIARILYFLSRLEPGRENPCHKNYVAFVDTMNRWIRSNDDCRALLTALNLIVYYMRDTE